MSKTQEVLKLAQEYRSSMPIEVLHAWAEQMQAVTREALAEQPAQQEPVGEVRSKTSSGAAFVQWFAKLQPGDKLYTSPPAQQQEPKPKFVRNVDGVPCITLVEHERLMRSRSKPAQQEPVAYMDVCEKGQMSNLRFWNEPDNIHQVPLYTSPQPSKPLTDEQIEQLDCVFALWDDSESCTIMGTKDFARAIEAAHGIKENKHD